MQKSEDKAVVTSLAAWHLCTEHAAAFQWVSQGQMVAARLWGKKKKKKKSFTEQLL